MTLNATYNDDLARVQLAVTGAGGASDYALFERSTDQITWTQVRGGQTVSLVAGACSLDDYEFTAGVTNYYRASYVDTGLLPSFVAAGTAATGNNTSVVPAAPAGLATGDLKLILASIRNSGAGTVVTPAGWTKVAESGNLALLARVHQPGDTPPTVTFAGGVVNADTLAQMACFRNSQSSPTDVHGLLNGSSQNVAMASITQIGRGMILYLGWKQDDMTSSTTPTFATKIGDVSSTAGDDASMFWDFFSEPDGNAGLPFGGDTVTITGGVAAISRSIVVQFPAVTYASQDTTNVAPAMTDVWLKNVLRPNLNRKVEPVNRIQVSRKSRSGVFDIVGRTMPIAVTDVRGGREFDLTLFVEDYTERDELDNTLATGDVMFLHIPPGNPTDSAYVLVGNTSWSDATGIYGLPLTEVAAPDGTLVGDTILWLDVIAEYATWSAVIGDEPTWSDLLSQIAPGDSVIVP